jgi:hypothetical protein
MRWLFLVPQTDADVGIGFGFLTPNSDVGFGISDRSSDSTLRVPTGIPFRYSAIRDRNSEVRLLLEKRATSA